jgi:heat shock protein HslJ
VKRAYLCSFLPLAALVAATISCRTTGDLDKTVDEAEPVAPPTTEELRNATYDGFEELDHPVTLVDGSWEGEPYQPGAASRPTVRLVEGLRLTGDVNGDGSDEAIAFLAQNSGGSGEFIYLAVVGHPDGTTGSLDMTPLGDRTQIREARIDGSRIALDVVRHGPDDPACCPGELATMEWEMTEQGLSPVPGSTETSRLSLDTIAEIEWTLRDWKRGEPANARPEVVLKYTDGRFIGIGGCNTFFAVTEPGKKPGHIAVGPPGRTRKACPEPSMTVEERFLKQLHEVRKFGFLGARLSLTYKDGERYEMMLFERRGFSAP